MLKADETSGNILFEEKQKFPRRLNILVIGIILFTIVIAIIAGYTGPEEERSDMWLGLAVAVPIEILILVLFQNMRLEKIVTSNGLYFRWVPWQRKFRVIEKGNIKTFEMRKSPPLNYGIHWFPGYGWVHNATAGEGLQLYLVNGNKIFLSTIDMESFIRAINSLVNPTTKSSF
jgi:hypothetical protein